MGMYTELRYCAELKQDVPDVVVKTLLYMLNSEVEDRIETIPDHPLFSTTSRWTFMLRCDSYYFTADTHSTLRLDEISDTYILCIQCNLKNYNDEIEKFLDWIEPYVAAYDGEFMGYSRYEECNEPTLIYHKEKKHA